MAANTRCEEVVLLDLRGRSTTTDFFVIATGTSPRQMRTVVDELEDLGKKLNWRAWKVSGYESARWIVVDCVNVVAHIFESEARDFYDLELLWGDSPRIDWRAELGLPPASELRESRVSTQDRFAEASGMDELDAEQEDARLDGDDQTDEAGDADVDEDAEEDAPIVMELPDESTGSNSVEFVEIDPPSKRRQRGRAVYPTPIGDQDEADEEAGMRPVTSAGLGAANQSLDEDDQERDAESAADGDAEGVSKEDLPRRKIINKPMGGVSAGMATPDILDNDDEESQSGSRDLDDEAQDHRDEIPEAHETAAETLRFAKRTSQQAGVTTSTQEPGDRAKKAAIRTRADMSGPKGKTVPGGRGIKSGDARPAAKKKVAAKATAKKTVAKKAAPKKAAAKKPAAKKAPAKKPAAKKAAAKKPAARKKK